ncbi:MAG: lysine 2,3-aminomutase [Alphaproteobacteria bacterium]|nr:lysine 2,3-aminomutase [Alphaproteobacteria bacterium]
MRMRFYNLRDIDTLPQLDKLSSDERFAMKVVANVLPFRANNYVVDELIDWDAVPDDPMFRLVFYHWDMLSPRQFESVADALRRELPAAELRERVDRIRLEMNPHPSGQLTDNVPLLNEEPVPGVQHKYRETALVFPAKGQTCFSYCTFCFRWPQFVNMEGLKFSADSSRSFVDYLRGQPEVTDVLFTGGDPLIMNAAALAGHIEPLLEPEFDHLRTIRIGSKVLSFWPYRFLSDRDADDLLRLFERVVASGKHLALMGHFNHWQELGTAAVGDAVRRIHGTGAQIRVQAPLLRHINDSADVWARLWQEEVEQGMIPYYMFVERDTGPCAYFEVPLAEAWEIFRDAYSRVSGLARTVRGPVMSAKPGKVQVDGVTRIAGERVMQLSFLQGRNPDWVRRPFFAKFDAGATWLNDLEPAFGESRFFYEDEAGARRAA